MPFKPLKTFNNTGNASLSALFETAARRAGEEQRVLAMLPAPFREKCRYGGFNEGELTLVVPTSTLATQIRYRQYDLLQVLRQDDYFRNAWRIRTRVALPQFGQPTETVKRLLSNENARLLEEEAGHTEDEALRKVLLRLARHHQ